MAVALQRSSLAYSDLGLPDANLRQSAVQAWLNAIDPGGVRAYLCDTFSISTGNLSALITASKLRPEHLREAASFAGLYPATGLAVAGLLTLGEAGWRPDEVSRALASLSELDLVDHLIRKLESYRRQLSQYEESRKRTDSLG